MAASSKPQTSDEAWRILQVDGASRGNPGPAAAGIVLKIGDAVVWRFGERLGRLTNNQAEYRGLIIALRALLPTHPKSVQVQMDSQLVILQMTGHYKVRNANILPLHAEATALVDQFQFVQFTHIPRFANAEADRLANAALDNKALADELRPTVLS